MTGSLINVVLIFLAYLLIGKIEDIGYRKGYQDGAASLATPTAGHLPNISTATSKQSTPTLSR